MTNKRFTLILLAVLTALMLAGCGRTDDSTLDSSSPEGIQTWGVDVDPSAQPSMGQVMPEILETPEDTVDTQDAVTTITGEDAQTEGDNTGDTEEEEETTPTPTKKPSSSGSGTSPSASPSASPSPTIAPPAPMSSATISDVEAYVGRQLSELIEELGYPSRSDYELIDEEDPTQGELGTLYFTDFTVETRRDDSGETVISVTPTAVASEEPSQEPSPSPSE